MSELRSFYSRRSVNAEPILTLVPFRIPGAKINWTNSSFLIGTGLATFTVVPYYIWQVGIDVLEDRTGLEFTDLREAGGGPQPEAAAGRRAGPAVREIRSRANITA